MTEFKTSGPRTFYKYGAVRCCRLWEIVTSIILVTDYDYKEIPQWYRECGLCKKMPRLVREDRPL